MAVLQKIRERTVLLLFMIGIGMLGFLFMDSNQTASSCNPQIDNNVGSILGDDISSDYFRIVLDQISQQYSENTQGQNNEIAWNRIVQTNIIENLSEDLGLVVSGREIYELQTGTINDNNRHSVFTSFFTNQETQQYDSELAEGFINDFSSQGENFRKYFLEMEDGVIIERLSQKYQLLVEKGMYSTNSELIKLVNLRDQKSTVQYVSIPYNSIEDIEVSEEEILKYYNDNIDEFYNDEEKRSIEFITFNVTASSEDDKNINQYLIDLVENFNDSEDDQSFVKRYSSSSNVSFQFRKESEITDPKFSNLINMEEGYVDGPYKLSNSTYRLAKLSKVSKRPDSIEARHILLSSENYTIDSAKVLLRTLKKQINEGSDFETFAIDYSDDKGSSKIGGDLGWFKEGTMVPEFNDVCFSSNKGDLKIVTTQFGVHLIEIVRVSKLVKKYKIVYLDKEIVPSSATKDSIYTNASDYIMLLKNKSSDTTFKSFAENKNMLWSEGLDIQIMDFVISNLDDSREIVRWMFNEDTDVDDFSENIYTCGGNYVIAYLSKIQPKGNMDFETVKDIVKLKLQTEKKYENISSQIEKDFDLEKISEIFSSEVKTVDGVSFDNNNINGIGNEPSFVGTVSTIKSGKISTLIKGVNSAYVLSVNSPEKSLVETINPQERKSLLSSLFNNVFYTYVMEILKDDSHVTDNRIRFY